MASFYVQRVGEDFVNIRVMPSSPYTSYRVFVRLSSDQSDITYDKWFSDVSYSFDAYVSGLRPGTEYAVNVQCNTSPTVSGATWIGTQYFTTTAAVVTSHATVYFNANGGSGAPGPISGSTTNTSGNVQMYMPADAPSRQGYAFAGWGPVDTPNPASVRYSPGGSITVWGSPGGVSYTVYAVWVQSGGGALVSNGASRRRATPWIFYNGSWHRAAPWVYSGGWRKGV